MPLTTYTQSRKRRIKKPHNRAVPRRCSRPLYSSQTTNHTNTNTENKPSTSTSQSPLQTTPSVQPENPRTHPNNTTIMMTYTQHRETKQTTKKGADIPPMSKPPTRHSQMAWPTNIVELLRKEVIQPHLPVRLPCYDLAPVTCITLGRPSQVRTLGTPDSHGLTGGVYKARERIHRSVADLRLLATPTSWGRVADPNPN